LMEDLGCSLRKLPCAVLPLQMRVKSVLGGSCD